MTHSQEKRKSIHDDPDVGIGRQEFYNYCYKYVQWYKKRDGNRYGIATIKNTKISRMEICKTEKSKISEMKNSLDGLNSRLDMIKQSSLKMEIEQ